MTQMSFNLDQLPHMANATLPSARRGFTSEFGKGSGGSLLLLSPANCCGVWGLISCCVFTSCLPYLNQRVINGLDIESNFVFSILTSFHTKSSLY